MENKLIQQLTDIDVENIKLDAVIQLKSWQRKMSALIDKTYSNRLYEINAMTLDITNEIKEKQYEIEQVNSNDKTTLLQLQEEIDEFKSNINIHQCIPDDFQQIIERTIRVSRDDDDLVIVENHLLSHSHTAINQESERELWKIQVY